MRPGSWDQLAERLDEAEATEAFDAEIGSRLQRMHVPYQTNSWATLAARLELERQRIQAIWHYKAMELSLLLLLLITAWQFLPQQPTYPAPPYGIPFAATEQQPALDGAKRNAGEESNTAISTNQQADNSETASFASQEGLLAIGEVARKSSASHQLLSNWPDRAPEAGAPVAPLSTGSGETLVHEAQDAQVQLKTFMAQKTARLNTPSDAFKTAGALAALAGGDTPLLDYGDPDELLDFIRPAERQTFVRIGFVGSPDYNRIVTPSQEVVDGTVVSFDRYSLGYGGGITLGVEHGRWEIETGAIYAARRYQAIPAVYISGNLREGYSSIGLSDFELNTVTAPLNFRYNLLLHDKWRFYAQAGASLNIVLGANYYLADQSEFAGIERDPNNTGGGTSAVEKPAALREKSLTAGWLEGGSFWDNATLYGDFGVGLERYMSPSWSLFVQPTYRHALPLFNDGLGPYRDRIHNFGIGMGVKVRL